jgi:hypothetical protein
MDAQPQLDIVLGARVKLLGREIDRSTVRHLLGRFAATLISNALSMPVYDTQCGAKLFRASPLTASLFATPFQAGWLFDVELLARYAETKDWDRLAVAATLAEIPLLSWKDPGGSSVRWSDYPAGAIQLGRIVWTHRGR